MSEGGPRVVVIGGGLAGITAALDCVDAGASVTLLEVRPRLGGAVYSFERDGLPLDNGQHVFLRCCHAYRALLARLGSTHRVHLQPRLEIPVVSPGGEVTMLRRSARLPAPLHLAGALLRYRHLSPRERISAARAARALGRLDPADPELDGRTLGSWLAEHGQSPRLGWRAESVRAAAGARAEGVRARAGAFEVEGDGGGLSAQAVIVAVPHQRAAALLDSLAPQDATGPRALESSPIVNLYVLYDRPVCELAFAAGVRTPVQYVFDRSLAAGLEAGRYLAVSLSAAVREMQLAPEALRERYLPALADLFPRAHQARVESFAVTREHSATFRAAPGVGALRPGARTSVAGLVLAGAFTDTGWPATLEGAVLSGHTAASEALAALA